MKVSIVIPCKRIDVYTRECIRRCEEIDRSDYEIIVLPDHEEEFPDGRVRVVATGPVRPLAKRFEALSVARGEVCAFIDSDAYPARDWLENALPHFGDAEIAAVAGPSLTPESDGLRAKASGLVLALPFGGGTERIRYESTHHSRYVKETPTCNFIVRKSVLKAIRDSVVDVWPGEEIALCGLITNELGKKILYDPQVRVYHHRRPLYTQHLRQIWNYGFVKGLLTRSHLCYVRPLFFAPSLFVVFLVAGLFAAMFNPVLRLLYLLIVGVYAFLTLFCGAFVGLRERSIRLALLTLTGIIATHVCYGVAFIKGLISRKV